VGCADARDRCLTKAGKFAKGIFFRQASALGAATIVGRLIGLLSFFLATQFIPLADIGMWSVYLAYFAMLARLVTLGYKVSLPNYSELQLNHAVRGIGLVVIAISTLSVPVFLLLAPEFAPALLLAGVAEGAIQIFRMLAVRNHRYWIISLGNTLPSTVVCCVLLIGFLNQQGDTTLLVYAHVAGTTLTAILLGAASLTLGDLDFVWHPAEKGALAFLRAEIRHPLLVAPSDWCNAAAIALPVILIERGFSDGAALAAQFALAQRVGFVPISILTAGIGSVLQGTLSQMQRDGSAEIRTVFRELTRWLGVLAVIVFPLYLFGAPPSLKAIFGLEFAEAGSICQIFSPAFSMIVFVAPLTVIYYTSQAHIELFLSQFSYLLISVGSIAIGIMRNDLLEGLLLFSALLVVRYVWIFLSLNRLIRSAASQQGTDAKAF